MDIHRKDVRRFFGERDADDARVLRDFGESIEPVLLGPDEGYVENAKAFLRKALCPGVCQLLVDHETHDDIELALAIAEAIARAATGMVPLPSISLVYKTSVFLAKKGLPLVLGCGTCPTKASRVTQ